MFALRIVVIALVMSASSAAWAQSNPELAQRHYESGRQAFVAHRYDEAEREFRAAYEMTHDSSLLFNLGVVYEELRNWRGALDSYRQYLREVPRAPNHADIERRIRVLEVSAANATPGTAPAVARATPPAPVAPARRTETVRPTAALAVAGVGVAGIIAGAVVGSLALGTRATLDRECPDPAQCADTDANRMTLAALGTQSAASDVLFALGAIVTIGGAAWYVLGATTTTTTDSRRASGRTPGSSLRVRLGPSGVSFSGAF